MRTTEQRWPADWDAAKRLKGRKRQVEMDMDDLLLGNLGHGADIQDSNKVIERSPGW